MPKMKTHKGLKKRVKITARGKVRFNKSFAGHLMSGKSAKRRRSLRKPSFIIGKNARKIKAAIGA
ncbi:MAG: 50S ribosomal protein L35 [Phycisphaerae bacterium]|nr:50S ribosomal protein L35 [Phycisphaerae bacterium]